MEKPASPRSPINGSRTLNRFVYYFRGEMKGNTSRTSRISADGRDGFDNPLPGVPDSKWQEFLEREENDMFLLELREEILQSSMEKIFENYLEKQAVAFTVHCSYLAWVKVLDVFFMFKDPGDFEDSKVIESWKPDTEPKPSNVDSWATECMKVKESTIFPSDARRAKDTSTKMTSLDLETESLETMSFMADLFEGGEEEFLPASNELVSSTSTRKKSIFTKTLSMSRDFLPKVIPLTFYSSCKKPGKLCSKASKK